MSTDGWLLWVPPLGGAGTGMGTYSDQVRSAVAAGFPELELVQPHAAEATISRVRSTARWLVSLEPVMAEWSRFAYREGVRAELRRRGKPAAIVVDHLMSSWAVGEVEPDTPVVYLAHNHEASVRKTVRNGRHLLTRALRHIDGLKAKAEERALIRRAVLVMSITDDDARRFVADGADQVVVWPPAAPVPPRALGHPPRVARALHLGSFEWRAKAQNMRTLVDAYEQYGTSAVPLDIAGPGPADAVSTDSPAVSYLGAVHEDEKWSLLETRTAGIVFEPSGGGFKLKVLDYATASLPVVWARGSVTGFGLRDGVTGFEVATAAEVPGAVERLAGSDELWQRCSEGIGQALSDYTVKQQERAGLAVDALRSVCGVA